MLHLLGLLGLGARRQLQQSDLHYGFGAFKAKYNTRAHALFPSEDRFHERLFDHEVALPHDRVQSYLVTLAEDAHPDKEARADWERRAQVTIDRVVDGDVMMHGTREHADALRALPEIRKVVPLVPELKLTPHFDELLPKNETVSLNLRMIAYKRHEHLRSASAALAPRYTAALRALCAAEEGAGAGGDEQQQRAAWRARPSCRDGGRRLAVEAHSDRMLVAQGVHARDAHAVAAQLAEQPEVLWVEPHPEYRMLNSDAVTLTQSGSATLDGSPAAVPRGTTPIWDMGLHGEGEIVGVGDSGLDTGHCFFEEAQGGTANNQNYGPNHRKVVAYRAYADGGATGTRDHGTHVVGSILGESSTAAANGATEMGSAYAAKVSFTDIGPGDAPGLAVPNDLANNYYNVDYDNGARIHSNSWGANVNAYTTSAVGTDEAMAVMTDLVILVAAGNSGQEATPGQGSIGAPATCKNCVSVGASENSNSGAARNDGNLAVFSSVGPGVGNRIKPDVSAPGFFVSSANSNSAGDCPITEMAGTSMATPITAGDMALIRQYLREGFYPSGEKQARNSIIPTGALMKAMVVSSSQKMLGTWTGPAAIGNINLAAEPYPNIYEGFGRVQLDHVLFAQDADGKNAGDKMLIVDDATATVTTGQQQVYTVPMRASDLTLGTAVKVVLTWTDPPGEPISNNPLVNNLDLVVEHNGNTYNGNGQIDVNNNVEAVDIPDAASATVTVTVKGTQVPEGPQRYALVVTGPLNTISPPPGSPNPPPPRPPRPPPAPLGDVVVLGVSLPLLVVALLAGGGFCFKKAKGGGAAGALTARASLKPLPPGWKLMTDPATGSPFYINEATGARQWEPPPATAPTPKSDLPPGWRSQTDPNSGQTYYINDKTGTSSWEKPSGGAASVPAAPAAGGNALPAGWTTGVDPGTGRTYWFNAETKASQWTPP